MERLEPIRLKSSPRLESDLSLMQTVYGVAFVFGFQKLAESIYTLLHAWFSPQPGNSLFITAELILLLTLSLLGVRFFWAVGNIRRFLLEAEHPPGSHVRLLVMSVNVPILMIHAYLFYLLCRVNQDMTSLELMSQKARLFVVLYSALLLLNAIWVKFLVWHRPKKKDKKTPEKIWSRNNLICGVGALAAMLFGFRKAALLALMFAALFYIINSVVDLYTTSETYLSPEEPESGPPDLIARAATP